MLKFFCSTVFVFLTLISILSSLLPGGGEQQNSLSFVKFVAANTTTLSTTDPNATTISNETTLMTTSVATTVETSTTAAITTTITAPGTTSSTTTEVTNTTTTTLPTTSTTTTTTTTTTLPPSQAPQITCNSLYSTSSSTECLSNMTCALYNGTCEQNCHSVDNYNASAASCWNFPYCEPRDSSLPYNFLLESVNMVLGCVNNCPLITDPSSCFTTSDCVWYGDRCNYKCDLFIRIDTNKTGCQEQKQCWWNSVDGKCNTHCEFAPDKTSCESVLSDNIETQCAWNSAISSCVPTCGSIGTDRSRCEAYSKQHCKYVTNFVHGNSGYCIPNCESLVNESDCINAPLDTSAAGSAGKMNSNNNNKNRFNPVWRDCLWINLGYKKTCLPSCSVLNAAPLVPPSPVIIAPSTTASSGSSGGNATSPPPPLATTTTAVAGGGSGGSTPNSNNNLPPPEIPREVACKVNPACAYDPVDKTDPPMPHATKSWCHLAACSMIAGGELQCRSNKNDNACWWSVTSGGAGSCKNDCGAYSMYKCPAKCSECMSGGCANHSRYNQYQPAPCRGTKYQKCSEIASSLTCRDKEHCVFSCDSQGCSCRDHCFFYKSKSLCESKAHCRMFVRDEQILGTVSSFGDDGGIIDKKERMMMKMMINKMTTNDGASGDLTIPNDLEDPDGVCLPRCNIFGKSECQYMEQLGGYCTWNTNSSRCFDVCAWFSNNHTLCVNETNPSIPSSCEWLDTIPGRNLCVPNCSKATDEITCTSNLNAKQNFCFWHEYVITPATNVTPAIIGGSCERSCELRSLIGGYTTTTLAPETSGNTTTSSTDMASTSTTLSPGATTTTEIPTDANGSTILVTTSVATSSTTEAATSTTTFTSTGVPAPSSSPNGGGTTLAPLCSSPCVFDSMIQRCVRSASSFPTTSSTTSISSPGDSTTATTLPSFEPSPFDLVISLLPSYSVDSFRAAVFYKLGLSSADEITLTPTVDYPGKYEISFTSPDQQRNIRAQEIALEMTPEEWKMYGAAHFFTAMPVTTTPAPTKVLKFFGVTVNTPAIAALSVISMIMLCIMLWLGWKRKKAREAQEAWNNRGKVARQELEMAKKGGMEAGDVFLDSEFNRLNVDPEI